MGKRLGTVLLVLVCMLALAGCECDHNWAAATCETPETCEKCGQIRGLTEKHNWVPATCETPETCEGCGKTRAEALGHRFAGDSCTAVCKVCGAADPAAGHSWKEATCEEAKRCDSCGLSEGEMLGHNWTPATCQMPATCDRCGKVDGYRLEHQLGMRDNGLAYKNGICKVCGLYVENFVHREKIYGWTEYEVAADGSYGLPVTYVRGASSTFNERGEFLRVDWFDEKGQQQYFAATQVDDRLTCVAFYKDGKVLYFSLNQFNNAPSVKETLTNYAAKHIAFDSVSFDYYDSIYYPNYTFLRLLGPGGEADRIGYVRTAYDEAHTAYTVVVNERTGEIWVEPGTWKY